MNFHIHIPTQLLWVAGGAIGGAIVIVILVRLTVRDIIGRFLNW